jgi:hypothetical protein
LPRRGPRLDDRGHVLGDDQLQRRRVTIDDSLAYQGHTRGHRNEEAGLVDGRDRGMWVIREDSIEHDIERGWFESRRCGHSSFIGRTSEVVRRGADEDSVYQVNVRQTQSSSRLVSPGRSVLCSTATYTRWLSRVAEATIVLPARRVDPIFTPSAPG